MEGCLIVTYRCNAKCYMCDTWQHPTKKSKEFSPELVDKIPDGLNFINITGGEPFIRDDLDEIIERALKKTKRLVISTNGYFTEKIIAMAEKYGNRTGVRISIEGLPAANDELRGIKNGFDRGLRTLLTLHSMGMKDIGFGITVSDRNARDMLELYTLANELGMEFATAVTHNSFYFHKKSNSFKDKDMIVEQFHKIAVMLLKSSSPKKWFRAYFNMGLANKVLGGDRPLPCEVGSDVFFMDPSGQIMPCNGSVKPMVMGNLNDDEFQTIWTSAKADQIRKNVAGCKQQCWMIGSASPAIKKKISTPLKWIIKNKTSLLLKGEDKVCLSPVEK